MKAEETRTVGILIFDEVEVLDFCGPFEVLSVARLDETKRRESVSPFQVVLVAETLEPVKTTGGMIVTPHADFSTCPKLDILLIPGGWGTRPLLKSSQYNAWILQRSREAELVCSVCTGSLLLAGAGLLRAKRATTHWLALDLLANTSPETIVVHDEHVVHDGTIMTSAGISAGIELALQIVQQFCGETIARNTARYMEYPYPESNARRVAIASPSSQ